MLGALAARLREGKKMLEGAIGIEGWYEYQQA
jgi:hypothetical protein